MTEPWTRVTANGLWPYSDASPGSHNDLPREEEIAMCREWIRAHVRKVDQIRTQPSFRGGVGNSYHLKHVVESWRPGEYISNGALIEAALREGYRAQRTHRGSLNAVFNMAWIVSPRELRAQKECKEKQEMRERMRVLRAEIREEARVYRRQWLEGHSSESVPSRPRRPKLPTCPGIYFIQSGADENGPIKIGQANNIRARVRNIQTSHPWPLRLLNHETIEDAAARDARERALHSRFSSCRLHGEWFRPDAEILEAIGSEAKAT